MPRYSLEPADDVFLLTATQRFVHAVDLPFAPTRVWATLTADDALVSWSSLITSATWTSQRPFGVGTSREVVLGGSVRLVERFYRWNENERMTFEVEAASVPGLRRFAEDLVLQPVPTGTRLQWTFAIEGRTALHPLLSLARPVNRVLTASIANGIAKARTISRSDSELHGRIH